MDTYLVAFEYGSGTVWGCVTADSTDHIEMELPEVDVHESPPEWMTVDEMESMQTEAIPVETPDCIDHLLDQRKARSLSEAC